jgi:transcriptional regulator with XRE-family HTH domain
LAVAGSAESAETADRIDEVTRVGIGQRIRLFREQKGWSLNQLAKESGVSKGYLWALEQDEAQNPSVDALGKVAGALEITTSDLLDEADRTAASPGRVPAGLQAFLAECEEKGTPLSQDDLDMLLNIRYRGRQPKTVQDWAYLYETIRRIIK